MTDKTKDQYQYLIITLMDGRKITAVIPSTCIEAGIRIASVQITEAKNLPDDCEWSSLDKPGDKLT